MHVHHAGVPVRRWERLAILSALITAGCNFPIPLWPDMPDHGTCRNFALTSWGGGAPFSELAWGGKDVVHIDEPMLPAWGWKGDLGNADDVCGAKGLGMVREKIAAARAKYPAAKVWLNWSTDELDAIAGACPGVPYGQGADIVSFDSYGGPWDWPGKTEYLLDMMLRQLEPGQQLGLVPEAFMLAGLYYEQIDYVHIAHLYWAWAMAHDDGRIYAVAPFYYQSPAGMIGFKDMPDVLQVWTAFSTEYPRCPAVATP